MRAAEKIGLLPQQDRMNDHAMTSFLHRSFNVAGREAGHGAGTAGYLDGYVTPGAQGGVAPGDVRVQSARAKGTAARNAAAATIKRATTPPVPPGGTGGVARPRRARGAQPAVEVPTWVPGAPKGAALAIDSALVLGGPQFRRAALHMPHGFRCDLRTVHRAAHHRLLQPRL